jgi:hypothetical protein
MVAPNRPAVLAAKILSTIGELSWAIDRRPGWSREEFEAIGAPFAGFRRIDHGPNADHDEAVPRRGFGAGLTGPTSPAFIDAACSSGTFGEFA